MLKARRFLGKLESLSDVKIVLGFLLLNLVTKFFRIWDPSWTYFDEGNFYLKAARGFLVGDPNLNPEHPPLSKLLIAFSIWIFGDNVLGWRFFSVILGSFAVVFLYFLSKRLTGSKKISLAASLFLTVDFGWFALSRIGIPEIFLSSFLLIAAFFYIRLYQEGKWRDSLLTGLFLGLALASKWSAFLLISWIFIFLLFFWKKSWEIKFRHLALISVLIVITYLVSYIPYLANHGFEGFIELQRWMVRYHTELVPAATEKILSETGVKLYPFPAWTWILNPIFPLAGTYENGGVKSILFFYNPIVLWGGMVSFVVLVWGLRKKVSENLIFVLASFAFLYFPWILSPRFSIHYYLLPAIPFLCLSLAIFLKEVWKRNTTLVYAIFAAAVIFFVVYYPLISGLTVPLWYLKLISGIVEYRTLN